MNQVEINSQEETETLLAAKPPNYLCYSTLSYTIIKTYLLIPCQQQKFRLFQIKTRAPHAGAMAWLWGAR